MDPRLLFDAFVTDNSTNLFPHLMTLACAVTPPEWRHRLCDALATDSVQALAAARESFIALPSSMVLLDRRLLLLIVVVFDGRMPTLWTFVHDGERSNSPDLVTAPYSAEIARVTGLPAGLFNEPVRYSCQVIALPPALNAPLLALHLFSQSMAKLRTETATVVNLQPVAGSCPAARRRLLAEIVLDSCIRRTPPVEPLTLTHSTLGAAVGAVVSLLPWCYDFARDKRRSQLDAIQFATGVNVQTATIASNARHELKWTPLSNGKELLLVAERARGESLSYGSVLRIHAVTDKHATVTVVAGAASFKRFVCNGVDRYPATFVGEFSGNVLVLDVALEENTVVKLVVTRPVT